MSNRAVSFNEQLNVVGIPAREGILSSDDEINNDDDEAKAFYKKCFRRGERGMSPETSPNNTFEDDHHPSLGDTMGGNDDLCGTWGTDTVPQFMISAAPKALAEYRRMSIDDRSDWSAKGHHQERHLFDASTTQQDLTSTGGRSSQGISSATTGSDMGWWHRDSNAFTSPSKWRGSSNNSSPGGGNPLDDDNDGANQEQQLPTGSGSKVHFLVSDEEPESRLLRLDPISTTSENSPSSNPLEYSSPKTVLEISGPSIDVPDVSGASWSDEHWCGPVQRDYALPHMATTARPPSVDILDRCDDDAMDDNSCNTSGVVDVPMMRSSSLSPAKLSPRQR